MTWRNPLKAFFENLKFKNKIVLYTSMILYLFVMGLGLLLFIRAVNVFNDLNQMQMKEHIDHLQSNTTEELKGYEKIVSTMLIDNEFQKMLEKQYISLTQSMEAGKTINAYLTTLTSGFMVHPKARIYINNTTISSRETVFNTSLIEEVLWYQKLRRDTKNTIHWTFEINDDNPNGAFICTSGIMNKTTGNVSAYLWISISMSSIQNYLIKTANDTNSIVILRNSAGDVYWASVGGVLAESYYNAIKQIPLDGSGSVQATIDQQSFDLYYFNSTKYDFNVISMKKSNSATTTYMNFLQYFVAVLAAVIALSMITLLLSVNLISKRLSVLTNKVHAIDERNPVFINDITGTDELGELGHAFEDMLGRMRTLMERNRQMERERFDLEFKALQSQINPHFLFNTLSTINIQAREIQADNISESINALAEFYRLSLCNGNTTIKVQDEMRMLAYYLQICRIRYRNQLQVSIEVDDLALDCYMPKLILQPFIENSVFHGFIPNSTREPTLIFRIKREDPIVVFTISDNGQGIDPAIIDHVMSGKSFAISNINARIKLLYGDLYGVTLTSTVGEGTTVTVTIPVLKDENSDSKVI